MGNREIKLKDLLSLVRKRIWVIAAAMILGIVIALYYSKCVIVPTYKSVSVYYVDTSTVDDSSGSYTVDQNRNLTVSRMVVTTYITILDTQSFADYLYDSLKETHLSREYSSTSLYNAISYIYQEESECFKISVTAYTPEDAATIAKCIENKVESYLVDLRPSSKGTIKIIDNARLNTTPTNVKTILNVVLGAFAGAAIAFLIFFIIEINDVRVKDEKELNEILNLPVIGIIPEYGGYQKSGYYYNKPKKKTETSKLK